MHEKNEIFSNSQFQINFEKSGKLKKETLFAGLNFSFLSCISQAQTFLI